MVCLPNRHCVVLISLLGSVSVTVAAQAQSITSADTATTVQQTGRQYQIDGGNLSGDSTALVYSFDQFGLLTGESAQFSNPATVETIIGRVLGGDASIIDGLLAVEGEANLYLVNPAGVLFGENSQLNLGGSFSASTATGLTFGSELLDVLGSNDYGLLNGAPTGYVFGGDQASAVVNMGELAVGSGQSLTLLGGQVVNTGQLSAPNGDVLVMAVPGENRVRLSQTGSLLDLELETATNAVAESAFTVSTVPALLTGASDLGMATAITVNSDGSVSLSGSSLQIPLGGGTTVVSGELSADGGTIGVLGDQIALVAASVDVSGAASGAASGAGDGGTVLIGGDERGNGSIPNATVTVIDETSVVRADAGDTGDGGRIVAWGTQLLRSAGQLLARGGTNGGDGGFVETSSLGGLEVAIAPDVSATSGLGGLWLLDPANIRIVAGETNANITETQVEGTSIFDSIGSSELEALLGVDLILAALSDGINVEVRTTGDEPGEGNITLETPLDYDETDGSLGLFAEGAIEIQADIFDSQALIEIEGLEPSLDSLDLTLQANDQITITGNIDTGEGFIDIESLQGDIDVSGELVTSSGDIDLIASQGAINVTAPILTSQEQTTVELGVPLPTVPPGGDVTLEAQESIVVADITTRSPEAVAGDVFVQSLTSTIEIGAIDVSSSIGSLSGDGGAGDVTLKAEQTIIFDSVNASNSEGDAGTVEITSFTGNVRGIGLIPSLTATIAAEGDVIDGSIIITHDGGSTGTPFDLGDASINGTAGALTTRTNLLEDGNPNEPFLGSFDADTIQIVTSDAPAPEIDPPETDPPGFIPDCISDCSTTTAPENLPNKPRSTDPEGVLKRFEEKLTTEVVDYLKPGLTPDENLPIFNSQSLETADLPTTQENLLNVQAQTGKRPALIYAVFGTGDVLRANRLSDPLELLLITAEGDPKYMRLPATRGQVLRLVQRFRRQVATPSRINGKTYLEPAQALYQLLIAPLEAELKAQNIDTLSFITDAGLRSMPLAALHDGENFIIQNYNIGLMPSLSLTDLTYQDLSRVSALVAGTSAFANQTSLPGVPVELGAIASKWRSKVLQDDAFSLDMLKDERQQSPYGIIHLATHGEFNVGNLSKSYLYFHNERLALDQLRTIGLNRPSVELLTLSACQTALGNRSAELGFAGFAILAGAKTSVASLWNVSDQASAGLMIEFYRQLQERQPTIKAEALREAQLAMLRGDIVVDGDQLRGLGGAQQLPMELAIKGQTDFSHPYYWAAFSLVGSPW